MNVLNFKNEALHLAARESWDPLLNTIQSKLCFYMQLCNDWTYKNPCFTWLCRLCSLTVSTLFAIQTLSEYIGLWVRRHDVCDYNLKKSTTKKGMCFFLPDCTCLASFTRDHIVARQTILDFILSLTYTKSYFCEISFYLEWTIIMHLSEQRQKGQMTGGNLVWCVQISDFWFQPPCLCETQSRWTDDLR
jgi:hypothetical protein